MRTGAKVVACVIAVAVLAGMTAMAVPALASVRDASSSALGTANSFGSPDVTTKGDAASIATDSTDYSTWSEEDLAAARAKHPYPLVVNHPSRFVGDCLQNSTMTASGSLRGAQALVDMRPSEYAKGTVTVNAEGTLATYTVAAGDAGVAIGERFCVDYITVFQYNDIYPVPHPGDVVLLLPEYRL